jgi:preprotein translocase subunit YajC
MNKKGTTILVENIIFIILNLIFLAVLILFLLRQGSGAIVLEETYSKNIAMLADSAQPVMLLKVNMEKGEKIAKDNGIDFNEVVKITENKVEVKLSENGGYTYAFFNDVDVMAYAERDDKNEYTGMYILTINVRTGING